jgi:hypothetical protein
MLRGGISMMPGLEVMSMREKRMVRGSFMIVGFSVRGGLAVVLGSVFKMLGGFDMMFVRGFVRHIVSPRYNDVPKSAAPRWAMMRGRHMRNSVNNWSPFVVQPPRTAPPMM